MRVGAALVVVSAVACSKPSPEKNEPSSRPVVAVASAVASPKVLYWPDAAVVAPAVLEPVVAPAMVRRCPPEMVDVGGRFCIDRWEVSLVERTTGAAISPYYHPTPEQARASFRHWEKERLLVGPSWAHRMPLPELPDWVKPGAPLEPSAASAPRVVPNGYLNFPLAERACRNAGKRLCTSEEWVTACRGERGTKFPYGETYQDRRCNVFRGAHPAARLHDDASSGHLDPRLNLVEEDGVGPLLRPTGDTAECKSSWNGDAVMDMVGNLDEWIDDPGGTFVGGFYARATREGCDARIESHAAEYFDYSLGTRCCR